MNLPITPALQVFASLSSIDYHLNSVQATHTQSCHVLLSAKVVFTYGLILQPTLCQ